MLKKRIITALVLAPLIILAIFKLTNDQLAVLFAFITLVGAWEWSNLIGLTHVVKKIIYVFLITISILAVWIFIYDQHELVFFSIVGVWWVVLLFALMAYKSEWLKSKFLEKILMLSAFIVLVPAWLGLVKLHEYGISMLLFFLVIIWAADIAAYFVGKKFGKNKLAPELSPGKSREGLAGALLAAVLIAYIGIELFSLDQNTWVLFITLCVFVALISVVGDLYESLLKRSAGVKDSGKILPGHGGVLDRIDSITAAAPIYVLGLIWVL